MNAEQKVYLRNNVQVEPLVNDWFAWVQLISPVTTALNMVRKNLDIMNSYIMSAPMHAAAIANPFFKGGPFIDLKGERVEDIKALRDRIQSEDPYLFELVEAISDLEDLLKSEAKGFALESLYEKIPKALRGYVDLYYDLDHKPGFKLLESLLYRSKYYQESRQSIALSEINSDSDRPFIMSTPRLDHPKVCKIHVPFKASAIDELFKMKRVSQPLSWIKAQLGITAEQADLFESFFTIEAPEPYQKYTGDKVRTRYFGHACILIETADVSILVDPVLSYTFESDISRYTYDDLPDVIDYVLITHSHQDHILIETMLQIRHKVKHIVVGRNLEGIITDPSLRLMLNTIGFHNVIEISDLMELPIPKGRIMGLPFMGEHHDLFIHSKSGYFVEVDGKRFLIMADSCNIDPKVYEHVHRVTGDVDVLFLGMECDGAPVSWPYGPFYREQVNADIDKSRRGRGCDFEEGMGYVEVFNPKEAYVYAMGDEPWVHHLLGVANGNTQSRRRGRRHETTRES
ncbi:MAG: MBL fold metallo-hydrolase, partial [Bacteroidota bacterium]